MNNQSLLQQSQFLLINKPANMPITVLHIGQQQTEIIYDLNHEQSLILQIGTQSLTEQYFHQGNVTPLAIENAIVVIEDQIMTIPHQLLAGSSLFTFDERVRDIAKLAGIAESTMMVLDIDSLEWCFNHFADVISGYPAILEGLPTEPEFAATLLILREWMHHLHFTHIIVKSE